MIYSREATNEVLVGVLPMVKKVVSQVAKHRQQADKDFIANEVLEHLGRYSLPKYDPAKGTKLSTFLYGCAARKAIETCKPWHGIGTGSKRVKIKFDADTANESLYRATAADTGLDYKIESIAADVQNRPEKYLTKRQAVIFRATLDAPPGTLGKDIAEQLGITYPAYSDILLRIRQRLAKIDIEEHSCQSA